MSSLARKREKRRIKAEQEGRAVRAYMPTGIPTADKAQWKRDYKHRQRVALAKDEGRVFRSTKRHVLHDAHVVDFLGKMKAPKHDAHVKRYAGCLLARQKSKARYDANPQLQRERRRAAQQALVRSYVVYHLTEMGIPRDCITEKIVELKREQITLRRFSRELKRAATNSKKEPI